MFDRNAIACFLLFTPARSSSAMRRFVYIVESRKCQWVRVPVSVDLVPQFQFTVPHAYVSPSPSAPYFLQVYTS